MKIYTTHFYTLAHKSILKIKKVEKSNLKRIKAQENKQDTIKTSIADRLAYRNISAENKEKGVVRRSFGG